MGKKNNYKEIHQIFVGDDISTTLPFFDKFEKKTLPVKIRNGISPFIT